MAWIQLTSIEQLRQAIDNSAEKPQLFFKHSTRCIISKMALNDFEKSGVLNSQNSDFYLLDLLNFREISNKISEMTSTIHQSPQVILFFKNNVVYSATHERIDGIQVQKLLGADNIGIDLNKSLN
jgi:bacillithiol system protein YtxJ